MGEVGTLILLGFLVPLLLILIPFLLLVSLLIAHPWLWLVLIGLVLLGLWHLATHAEEWAQKLGPKDPDDLPSLDAEAHHPKELNRG